MAANRGPARPQPENGVAHPLPAPQPGGVLLPLDERARRQVRIKQLNIQKAQRNTTPPRGSR